MDSQRQIIFNKRMAYPYNCMGHSDYFDPFLVDHKVVTPPVFFCGL
jgi:hypothetical protein